MPEPVWESSPLVHCLQGYDTALDISDTTCLAQLLFDIDNINSFV